MTGLNMMRLLIPIPSLLNSLNYTLQQQPHNRRWVRFTFMARRDVHASVPYWQHATRVRSGEDAPVILAIELKHAFPTRALAPR
jgi:hypothetical protein